MLPTWLSYCSFSIPCISRPKATARAIIPINTCTAREETLQMHFFQVCQSHHDRKGNRQCKKPTNCFRDHRVPRPQLLLDFRGDRAPGLLLLPLVPGRAILPAAAAAAAAGAGLRRRQCSPARKGCTLVPAHGTARTTGIDEDAAAAATPIEKGAAAGVGATTRIEKGAAAGAAHHGDLGSWPLVLQPQNDVSTGRCSNQGLHKVRAVQDRKKAKPCASSSSY